MECVCERATLGMAWMLVLNSGYVAGSELVVITCLTLTDDLKSTAHAEWPTEVLGEGASLSTFFTSKGRYVTFGVEAS